MMPCWRAIEGRTASDGAPELFIDGQPTGRGVSLTDRAGCAACLVADGPAAIGCDLEIVETRSDAFVHDYLTPPERDLVAAAGPARDVAANLIWSAKESALKVLRTGLRRDTRSVEVTVEDLTPPEHAWSPLQVHAVEGLDFGGWWRRSGSFLLTACASGHLLPPTALEGVSPLDEESPTHNWLGGAWRRSRPQLGVSWPVAHRHYAAHADGLLTEPEPPAALGIDETRRGTPMAAGPGDGPVGADGAVRDELH